MSGSEDTRQESPVTRANGLAAMALAGYGSVTWALTPMWGNYSLAALGGVWLALALFAGALSAGRREPGVGAMRVARRLAWLAAFLPALLGAWHLPSPFLTRITSPEGGWFWATGEPAVPALWVFAIHATAAALLATHLPRVIAGEPWRGSSKAGRRWSAARSATLFALALLAGAWMLRASPRPEIDVWEIHQQGAALLLEGRSPYGDVIRSTDTATFDRVHRDYPYPPIELALTTAGYLVAGDSRWAALVSVLVGSGLLWLVARRRVSPGDPWPDLLAAALLFHPRGLFVLDQAWGEPLALPLLAGFALLADAGRRRAAAILLGLLAFAKQYYLLFLGFAMLLPVVGIAGAALAAAVGGSTVLPFLLLDPGGLWEDLVLHHLRNPFRPDALSVGALYATVGVKWPAWIGFAAAGALLVALYCVSLIRRRALRLDQLLVATTLGLVLFFVLGRQAFCNYYYLAGATALLAVALSPVASRPDSAARVGPPGEPDRRHSS